MNARAPHDDKQDLAARRRLLEAENARLRAELARLSARLEGSGPRSPNLDGCAAPDRGGVATPLQDGFAYLSNAQAGVVSQSPDPELPDLAAGGNVEAALRASNAFNRAILDSVAASVAVVSRDGTILAVNEAWRCFAIENSAEPGQPAPRTGIGANYFEVCGAACAEAISRDAANTLDGIRAVLDGRLESFRLEYPCHSPTQRRWFVMIAMPLGPEARDGVVITHTDITQVKEAEEQLRIAAVAFESQSGMLITDAHSTILRVNRAFTEITGYRPEEVVGRTPRLLNSGRHDAAFFRDMWDSINNTGSWQGEIWDRRKNGEEYQKWLAISAVKDAEGNVTHYVGSQFDISERKRAEERIRELAFFDQLTRLPNRRLLLDRLAQTLAASSRSGDYAALMFIDLDHFKTLNDTKGHAKGDALLRQAAQRIVRLVREGDTVARLGGDEFVVLLSGLSRHPVEAASDAETIAEAIRLAIHQPFQLDEITHHATASIGVTLFRGDLVEMDTLMKQADLAMYRSKGAGRNRVRFFDPVMESAVMERAALEDALRRAIDRQEFELHYQAQVDGAGRIAGAEALARWRHPQRGLISPADFIPLAEDTGLILPLGDWVLETVCEQLARWAREPRLAELTLSANVSARQIQQADFVDEVLATLRRTGANPRRLKLELTETLLAENIQDMIEKMSALKARGLGFALDDFGTGYSSLYYLKRLPLDQLKIDRSFVRDVLVDPNDAAIARTIVALARSLGLDVIAEGVETEAQREFLALSGCDAYQGYLFSRPLPLEAFEALLARSAS